MKIEQYLGHTFVSTFFSQNGNAIDCGSNNGGFARWLSENSNLNVHSFEADPRLFEKLPALDRVRYSHLAVAGVSGTIELGLGESHCSSVVYREGDKQNTVTVPAISLDDYCKANKIESIDLLKLDIEGAELDVLEGISPELLSRTMQITVEFHDFLNAADIPRIKKITENLVDAGFYFIRLSTHTWGDCLFLNRRLIELPLLKRIELTLNAKYFPGLARIGRRLLGKKV